MREVDGLALQEGGWTSVKGGGWTGTAGGDRTTAAGTYIFRLEKTRHLSLPVVLYVPPRQESR